MQVEKTQGAQYGFMGCHRKRCYFVIVVFIRVWRQRLKWQSSEVELAVLEMTLETYPGITSKDVYVNFEDL